MADRPDIVHLHEVDSTNEEAKRRAHAGQIDPVWIYADIQTKGRGRRGREWSSQSGNLFATGLYTLSCEPSAAAQLSFASALAVADIIQARTEPGQVKVKWPNDVLIEGQKVAGILLESGWNANKQLWLAVGIGINLKTHPAKTEWPSTCLSDHGFSLGTTEAIEALVVQFEIWKDRWQQNGFQPLRDSWLSRAYGLGQTCHVRLQNEELRGVFSDLMADGSLRLDLADGQRRFISAGDVFFPDRA